MMTVRNLPDVCQIHSATQVRHQLTGRSTMYPCSCGYRAKNRTDLDEHIAAATIDGSKHEDRSR